jgi:hypothetical protein
MIQLTSPASAFQPWATVGSRLIADLPTWHILGHSQGIDRRESGMRRQSAAPAFCAVILACAGCSETTNPKKEAAEYRPTAPVLRPAYEWELRRYLIEEYDWPMIWGPDGRWQFQGVAPTYGTYRLGGDVVCTRQDGAAVERCANLSIGPQGPTISEWRETAVRKD